MKTGILFLIISLLYFPNVIEAQQFELQSQNVFSTINTNYGNAVADYDLDGDLDIFIVAYKSFKSNDKTTWSRLLNNTYGRFEDVTEKAGLDKQHSNTNSQDLKLGASWGDYNNDGYPDLLLAHQDGTELFQNMQNGTFKDVTKSSNITSCIKCNNTSGLWWDYDNDGDLDLYLSYLDRSNRLYNNKGDGTFQEIIGALNLDDSGRTWSCLPIDVNKDGWMDIYVVNDFGLSNFYISNKGESFINATSEYNLENKGCGMGSTIGDYNNDGNFDIYVTNISESRFNPLFMGNKEGPFKNESIREGVGNGHFGWGTKLFDADNDGDQDLYIVNGDGDLHYDNVFFKNLRDDGQNRFFDWTEASQANGRANGMGAEVFDYDNDGDLDILVSNTNDTPYLYKNTIVNSNAWIQVDLEGSSSNKNAFGAVVETYVSGKSFSRFHHGSNIMGQSIKPVHFGIGETKKVDSITVKWPSGNEEIIRNLAINQKIKVVESQGMVEGDLFSNDETDEDLIINKTLKTKVSTIPNPFDSSTKFHVNIIRPGLLSLKIYSISGINVYDFQQQIETIGDWEKSWDGNNKNGIKLPSGMYLYKIKLEEKVFNGKLIFKN